MPSTCFLWRLNSRLSYSTQSTATSANRILAVSWKIQPARHWYPQSFPRAAAATGWRIEWYDCSKRRRGCAARDEPRQRFAEGAIANEDTHLRNSYVRSVGGHQRVCAESQCRLGPRYGLLQVSHLRLAAQHSSRQGPVGPAHR